MSCLDLTIHEMHKALVDGKTTPLELVEEAIVRIKANHDNPFEALALDEAIAFAKTLTVPEVDNLFWGIPVFVKDNFSTKGIETTGSSNILKGYVPVFDATVVTKLRAAKAIILGKTTLDELAMGGSGTTGHKGRTYNPWDQSHTRQTGGSSAGSANVVAAGIVPFALGSDTGDSVRKPASFNGLVGFKPTWGMISRYGLFPFAPSLDHVAYFTRSAKDAAIALELLTSNNPDTNDATNIGKQFSAYENIKQPLENLRGVRIAIIKQIVDSIKDEHTVATFKSTVDKLQQAGATISYVDISMPILKAIFPTYIIISCAEATSNNANLDGVRYGPRYDQPTYIDVMKKARTEGFSELIKRRFIIGGFALMRENQAELFLQAQRARRLIVNKINEILATNDFLYLPAAPSIAPLFEGSDDRLSDTYLLADSHLALGNFAGLPSITLPIGFKDGMPLGSNLMGRAFAEKQLFDVAIYLEKITGLENISARRTK